MSDTHEEWRIIQETDGKYSISDKGRVRNNNTMHILSPSNKEGYRHISLYINGKPRPKSVHRLVAMEFIPNPENKREVNHKDGNPSNNCVENLEWVTPEENMQHAIDNHLWEKGNERYIQSGCVSRRERNKKNYLRRCEQITEEQLNYMVKQADKNKTTVYGLVKLYEDKISELQNLLDSTEQNEFLVKCQKQEINILSSKIKQLEYQLSLSKSSIGMNDPIYDIGNKKNHLTIIGYAKDGDGHTRLVCRCDCGNIRLENQTWWRQGIVKSCGCKSAELAKQNNPGDPRRQTQIYDVWTRYNRKDYWCDEWKDFDTFYEWSINNGFRKGVKLYRDDSYKDFSPGNCHWGGKKPKYQRKSRRKHYDVFGESLTVAEMAGKYGILAATITYRLKQGLTPEQAVTIPMKRTGVESNSLGAYYANNE